MASPQKAASKAFVLEKSLIFRTPIQPTCDHMATVQLVDIFVYFSAPEDWKKKAFETVCSILDEKGHVKNGNCKGCGKSIRLFHPLELIYLCETCCVILGLVSRENLMSYRLTRASKRNLGSFMEKTSFVWSDSPKMQVSAITLIYNLTNLLLLLQLPHSFH